VQEHPDAHHPLQVIVVGHPADGHAYDHAYEGADAAQVAYHYVVGAQGLRVYAAVVACEVEEEHGSAAADDHHPVVVALPGEKLPDLVDPVLQPHLTAPR